MYELPKPIHASDEDLPHPEYASLAFVDASTLVVSDGQGTLYALRVEDAGSAQLLNSFHFNIPEAYGSLYSSVPFRIHSAVTNSESCLVVLSSRHYGRPDPADDATRTQKHNKIVSRYDIWAVSIDLTRISQDQTVPLDVVWHRRGEDVPMQVAYIASKAAFMLLGATPYRSISASVPSAYQPTPDELAPIPRAGENLDNLGATDQGPPRPPAYSWTQTDDSVTVAFPLPTSTPKDAIKVTLSPTTLTLFIQNAADSDSPVPLPRYALKKFWAGIHSSTSFWTLDREAEGTYGLLTLHLDKQHEGTRWAQVFEAAGVRDGEPEVPETLDPSELWQIRESLEKYTAALRTGEDASGLGLGHGLPSLAEGEMDDEVDADMGDTVALTWVGIDGSVPSWASAMGGDSPVNVLSTVLPGLQGPPSLVVKNGLDGLLFTFEEEGTGWTHTNTFCVLSFVLASKRDTRFVHHLSSRAVLAFESGARGLGGNVYIYQPTARPGDKWATQAVLKVGDGSGGPLLGVGAAKTKTGGSVILCLCEKELVVIHETGLTS